MLTKQKKTRLDNYVLAYLIRTGFYVYSKASVTSGCLRRDIILRTKHMFIKVKLKIYKACIRPILT